MSAVVYLHYFCSNWI